MLATLALRALVVLISFPGLSHFGFHRHKPAPRDTIPPTWKPATRLALEDQFVRRSLLPLNPRPVSLHMVGDPRSYFVQINPDSGTITSGTRFGEFPVAPEATGSLAEYSREATREAFQQSWREASIRGLNSLGSATPASPGANGRQGLSFQFPSPLPQRIQSLLGPGGPALNVSGSENISLSGTSTWTNQQTTLLGQSRSLFPSLDMQQNLDIRLEG